MIFTPPETLQQTAPVTATYDTGPIHRQRGRRGRRPGHRRGSRPGATATGPTTRPLPPSGCAGRRLCGSRPLRSADIALVQRGTCFFLMKAVNAEAAGAEAVDILNQGNTPARKGLIVGNAATLPDGSPRNLTVPVVGGSFPDGAPWLNPVRGPRDGRPDRDPHRLQRDGRAAGQPLDTSSCPGPTSTQVKRARNSRTTGPGSAALLEIVMQMAQG